MGKWADFGRQLWRFGGVLDQAWARGKALFWFVVTIATGILVLAISVGVLRLILLLLLVAMGLATVSASLRQGRQRVRRATAAGGPETITPPTIASEATVSEPEVIQGPRPGWTAGCEYSSATSVFGRGVLLSIENDRDEQAAGLRCVVEGPEGYRATGTSRVFGTGQLQDSESRHFPGEFEPKPSADPPPPGSYEVTWFAELDPTNPSEIFLARATFKVGSRGEFFCMRR